METLTHGSASKWRGCGGRAAPIAALLVLAACGTAAAPRKAGLARDGSSLPAGPLAGPEAHATAPPPPPCGRIHDVRAEGGDSIQQAFDRAQPGECVRLAPGQYRQDFASTKGGVAIVGSSDAVVSGSGARGRVFQVRHDGVTLHGFTIDGRVGAGCSCNCTGASFRDTLLYVQSETKGRGVHGLRVVGMTIQNARGECVRVKYLARGGEIGWSTIRNCGKGDFAADGAWCGPPHGKNGEGIYVGTAPEQVATKNPSAEPDVTTGLRIHHNEIETRGNECVDIKEGATGNLVEYNRCRGQGDPKSAGYDSRGTGNVFRFNEVTGSAGAGVRLGGDGPADGVANEVYANLIRENAGGGIRVQRGPQRRICGNVLVGNGGGDLVGPHAVGSAGEACP